MYFPYNLVILIWEIRLINNLITYNHVIQVLNCNIIYSLLTNKDYNIFLIKSVFIYIYYVLSIFDI